MRTHQDTATITFINKDYIFNRSFGPIIEYNKKIIPTRIDLDSRLLHIVKEKLISL